MNFLTVGISDMKVSQDADSVIITYALGSCIAVIAYDPYLCVGGMLHYMLPLSKIAPDKAQERPAMFGDTGIPRLFNEMHKLGCRKSNLIAKAAGGARLYDDAGVFDIGRRNYAVMRHLFKKNDVPLVAEDIGGTVSRTAKLFLADGRVVMRSRGQEVEL